MQLVNLSPLAAERLLLVDGRGEEILLVVVKATYEVKAGATRLADPQEPVRLADEYHGEPGKSSLKAAAEGMLFKPATDVLLTGHAYAPSPDCTAVDVRLRVGQVDKTVRVFGERRWRKRLGLFTRPGPPEPFERIPLTWERAFGGTDDSADGPPECEPRNPVGVGFRAKNSRRPVVDEPLPNLEAATALLRKPAARPTPSGLGPIGPHWSPRLRHAGTYDEAWSRTLAPLLPDDFDPRFFQVAPADQIYPGWLEEGAPIEVEHASPTGRLSTSTPAPRIEVVVKTAEDRHVLEMRMDTLTIDGDAERLQLVWRGSVSVHEQVYGVEWIKVTLVGGP